MKLTKVKSVLTRRLAWLTAKASKSPDNGAVVAERDALETLLRCQGMHDPEQLAWEIAKCEQRILPAEQRVKARAARGDELVGLVLQLVDDVHRAKGAAA